jgi:hypothetical protein
MGLTMKLACLSAGLPRAPFDVAARKVDETIFLFIVEPLRCRFLFYLLIARRLFIHRLH